jgi:kinesin family protein 5
LGQEDVEIIAVKLLFSSNMMFCVDSLNQKYTLAHQQMQQDYERLKQEENDKSNKLQELM